MIKLYLDEDVHKKIAIALRVKGYEVISAHEVKNWNISDMEQLEYAISNGQAIFTFNCGDFAKLHKEYMRNSKIHYGILLSKHIPLKESIKRLT